MIANCPRWTIGTYLPRLEGPKYYRVARGPDLHVPVQDGSREGVCGWVLKAPPEDAGRDDGHAQHGRGLAGTRGSSRSVAARVGVAGGRTQCAE